MEDETPCRPKNHQRRSSYFRRRSRLQIQDQDEEEILCNKENADARPSERIEDVVGCSLDSTEKVSDEPLFDLRRYIDDVKQERTDWKQTLLDRKRQYKNTLKHMTRMKRGEQDVDLSALSESDRNFLLVRPNYEHIYEKAKKLAIMATETSVMHEHVTHLHNQCLLRAEKRLDDLTTRIINMIDD